MFPPCFIFSLILSWRSTAGCGSSQGRGPRPTLPAREVYQPPALCDVLLDPVPSRNYRLSRPFPCEEASGAEEGAKGQGGPCARVVREPGHEWKERRRGEGGGLRSSAGLSWPGWVYICSVPSPWPVVTPLQAVPPPDAEMRGPLRPVSPGCVSVPPSRPSAVPALACVCFSESMSGL